MWDFEIHFLPSTNQNYKKVVNIAKVFEKTSKSLSLLSVTQNVIRYNGKIH